MDQPTPTPPSTRDRLTGTYHRFREYYQRTPRLRNLIWQRKIMPAFWTVASLISVTVNVILIAALLILGRQLFFLKNLVSDELINGLYENFALMNEAHILTTVNVDSTIQVQDQMPVIFDLPLSQDTVVVLVEDTPINNVSIWLNGYWIPTNIILPQDTPLHINLDLAVPVSTTVPVNLSVPVSLSVPVDIALSSTDLYTPFVGLQEVVAPYQLLLSNTPDTPAEVGVCQTWWAGWLCSLLFGSQ